MSDERDLTPEQEARVSRLLADARAEEPMPSEVAERLDRVLAGLADQPAARPPERHAPVVDLATRRRRRARSLLVAAAAVVVVGVGVGQLVDQQDGADDAGSGSVSRDRDFAAGGGEQESGPISPNAAGDGLSPDELRTMGEPARITTRSFAATVRRLQGAPGVSSGAVSGLVEDSDLAAPRMDFRCAPTDFGAGKLIAVRYNGSPAVLVYRPPAGGTQVVDLMQCRSGDILRSTTIPLP